MSSPVILPVKPESAHACPCGSGQTFGACCEPILGRTQPAETAERLMRARFTAHVVQDYRFLHETYLPTARQPFVEDGEAPTIKWERLVVHAHAPGRTPEEATVEFSAYGTEEGVKKVLEEKAEFVRQDGAWIYSRPLREGPAPVRVAKKAGRNDPCPCGSGKKYKHCCLAKG